MRHGAAPFFSCVGDNSRGQLGAETPSISSNLLGVPGIAAFVPLGGVGGAHACVRLGAASATSPILCWGDNREQQCGRGAVSVDGGPPQTTQTVRPIDDPRTDWSFVDAGRDFTCAVNAVGEVWCWGSNEFGQLGTGSLAPRRSAALWRATVPERVRAVDLSPDSATVCAVSVTNQIYCWGDNRWGQVGRAPLVVGVAEPTPTPTLVELTAR
jgi:alpha-tubulin suppressor-like RCC1 family protein